MSAIGRMYVLAFSAVAISAAQDLFELVPATGKPIRIHAIRLAQTTDVGDAQDEVRIIKIIRGYTTSGSGGTGSLTPGSLNENNTACGITGAEINNTTQANTGTTVTVLTEGWNVRSPYLYLPPPEARPVIGAGTRVVVTIDAPTDSITCSGEIVFEEMI